MKPVGGYESSPPLRQVGVFPEEFYRESDSEKFKITMLELYETLRGLYEEKVIDFPDDTGFSTEQMLGQIAKYSAHKILESENYYNTNFRKPAYKGLD